MASQRVKVDVALLIEAIERKKAEAIEAHDGELAKYDLIAAEFKRGLLAFLRETIKRVTAGEDVSFRYGELELPPGLEPPGPRPSASTSMHDKDIALLRMSSEPTLTISVDDHRYGRYL